MTLRSQARGTRFAKRQRIINFKLLSPYSLIALSFLIFCAAIVFPPAQYERYIEEQDLMYLNGWEVLFFLVCSIALMLGVNLGYRIQFSGPGPRPLPRQLPFGAIGIPLVIGIAATAVSIWLLLTMHPNLLENLLSGRGTAVKDDLMYGALPYGATTFPVLTAGIAWWASWKAADCTCTRLQLIAIRTLIGTAILASIGFEVIVLFRAELLAVMLGTAITLLAIRQSAGKLTRKFLWQVLAGIVVPMGGGMLAFSVMRGAADREGLIGDALGYTLASYNRLAAVLNGSLEFPYSGHGLYLSSYLVMNKSVNALVSFGAGYNPLDVWLSEFDAVQRAGLNSRLIWPGVYGYVYSDAGKLTPAVLVLFGVIIGIIWRKFERRETLGCILYPSVAALMLTLFGPNFLFSGENIALLLVGVCLTCYESQLALKSRRVRLRVPTTWPEPGSGHLDAVSARTV
jgi:hypothetical protein